MARDIYPPALSKTAKYKKITKPLLERKRRARINRCLDELKDLMVGALEIDDENMSKLEKADILELTVNHLTKIHSPKDPVVEAKKFQAGFGQCAAEACRFILALPNLDANVSQNLVNHLSRLVSTQPLNIQVPTRPTFSPPISPPSPLHDQERAYYSDDRSSTDGEIDEAPVYFDHYSDDASQYSAASAWSQPERRIPSAPLAATPSAQDLASPTSGLLTTVDRVPNSTRRPEARHASIDNRLPRSQYFNRVPTECKDAILQKIRQHIMDKRVHDSETDQHDTKSSHEYVPRISVREDLTMDDHRIPYSINNDTLDLRKIRTPVKSPEKKRYIEPPSLIVHQYPVQSPAVTKILQNDTVANETSPEHKTDQSVYLPEQLAVNYSNLPPKKKRKLLEYQEYKKQEESKRLENIANQKKKDFHMDGDQRRDDYDASNNNQWRPW